MKKYFVLLTFYSVLFVAKAQFKDNYVPIRVPDSIPPAIAEVYKKNLKTSIDQFSDKSDKSKFYKSRFTNRAEFLTNTMRDKDVYYDGPLYDYLNSILNNILDANHLPHDIRLFPIRSTVPNAVSYGEGTIFFHIGLINVFESEDQIAFVIGHELAHYYCKHFEKKCDKVYKTIYDKELIKAVKKGSKQEYNSYQTTDSIMKTMSLNLMFHSRETEMEADTMGFLMVVKSKYDPTASTRVMEIFDSCDRYRYKYGINYKEIFNFPDYPFKDKWLKYQMDDMWHEKEEDNEYTKSDSFSTHPDSKKRKVYMQELVDRYKLSRHPSNDGKEGKYTFDEIRKTAHFEMVEADFWHERYGKSLFRALMGLHDYPDNVYLQAMVSKNLYEIYVHQKKHKLGNHVAQPYVYFDDHYNQFLGFVQNMSLTDLSNLCYLYIANKHDKSIKSDDMDEALFMAKIAKGEGDEKALAEAFIKAHPDSRLVSEIKEEFLKPLEDPKKKKK